jgi:hypothetical protein
MLTEAEAELLLICARQSLSDELAQRAINILRGALRWPYIIEEASRHGTAPLLFRHLESLQQTVPVPLEEMHALRQAYVRSAFRTRVHEAAIASFIPHLVDAGVRTVLLKGAALTRNVYHDPVLRPYADVDLLIAEDKIDKAKQVLIGCGYSLAPELLSEKFNRDYHMNLPFVRREPAPIHIELHWKLTDRFSLIAFDEEEMLLRAQSVSIGAAKTNILDPSDELVYLAAHLDNHGYLNRALLDSKARQFLLHPLSGNRLIWFTDLHELISRGPNWAEVLRRAKATRAADALSVSLRLVDTLLGTAIDSDVLANLPAAQVSWPRRILARHVRSLASATSQTNFQRRFLSTRKGFELRLVRLIDIWQFLFPPREFVDRNYAAYVVGAVRQCTAMFFELLYLRALRAFGPNTVQ